MKFPVVCAVCCIALSGGTPQATQPISYTKDYEAVIRQQLRTKNLDGAAFLRDIPGFDGNHERVKSYWTRVMRGNIPVTMEVDVDNTLAVSIGNLIHHSNEIEIEPSATMNITKSRRSLFDFYRGLKCTRPTCGPTVFNNYGCWCGYGGSGNPIDGIDECCKEHDECYDKAGCKWYMEEYWRSYDHSCTRNRQLWCHDKPYGCAGKLCQCDSEFTACLKKFPCPKDKRDCPKSD